jgi:hypothetical protein
MFISVNENSPFRAKYRYLYGCIMLESGGFLTSKNEFLVDVINIVDLLSYLICVRANTCRIFIF